MTNAGIAMSNLPLHIPLTLLHLGEQNQLSYGLDRHLLECLESSTTADAFHSGLVNRHSGRNHFLIVFHIARVAGTGMEAETRCTAHTTSSDSVEE